jgi:hypothetical protein
VSACMVFGDESNSSRASRVSGVAGIAKMAYQTHRVWKMNGERLTAISLSPLEGGLYGPG